MQLLPDEEILVSSNSDTIILTNQRIHQSDKEWGSNPLLLVLSAICFLVGLFTSSAGYSTDATFRTGSFMLAIIFLVVWFYSQNRVVTIASNGGSKMNFRVAGMKAAAVDAFIDKYSAGTSGKDKDGIRLYLRRPLLQGLP